MARAKLSPEQREARRKERARFAFSDAAYQHFDPNDGFGYGSPEDWIAAAERIAGATKPRPTVAPRTGSLGVLGLQSLPATLEELKLAFRVMIKLSHPDYGGTKEKAQEVIAAYNSLKARY